MCISEPNINITVKGKILRRRFFYYSHYDFYIYECFVSGILHLLFLDSSWQLLTETRGSKSVARGWWMPNTSHLGFNEHAWRNRRLLIRSGMNQAYEWARKTNRYSGIKPWLFFFFKKNQILALCNCMALGKSFRRLKWSLNYQLYISKIHFQRASEGLERWPSGWKRSSLKPGSLSLTPRCMVEGRTDSQQTHNNSNTKLKKIKLTKVPVMLQAEVSWTLTTGHTDTV